MASCFDISIIDVWNTGDENVTNGSVDNYDFDWGSGNSPEENPPCGCRRTCCTCQTEKQPPVNECTCEAEEEAAEDEEDYPVVQL